MCLPKQIKSLNFGVLIRGGHPIVELPILLNIIFFSYLPTLKISLVHRKWLKSLNVGWPI